MDKNKKGFFPIPKLRLTLLCISLAIAVLMFTPFIMPVVTAGGTGLHCIVSCVLMCLNPIFIWIDFKWNK